MITHLSERTDASDNLKLQTSMLMRELGIPASLIGYYYIREAILYVCNDHMLRSRSDMNKMYIEIAARWNTESSIITRTIAYAIKISCIRGNEEIIAEIFGPDAGISIRRISNMEYISQVAAYIMARI